MKCVDRFGPDAVDSYGRLFDPGTLMLMSMGATAAGGAVTAAGTLAGGKAAETAGEMTKQADEMAAEQSFAAGQRKSLDTQERTRMAMSTATARAGANGVDAGSGSPLATVGDIAKRGSYQALMDMFNGESEATNLRNSGAAAEYGGKMQKQASYLSAAGTLASTAGSMFKTYGAFNYPTNRGASSVSL